MIPAHYFEVICCPKCRSDLEIGAGGEPHLSCQSCTSTYPVIDGIPVLLDEIEDEVSQIIKGFYDSEWQENGTGVLRAKVAHEDLSHLGQRYIQTHEDRFLSLFNPSRNRTFFLDAASGAQPRVTFGEKYTYHVCVDFSLNGLIESRKQLGDRAICVCGSLLNLPLKDSICDGAIASHALYHIDKDLQEDAIRQLYRVLRPGEKVLILYRNPNSFEERVVNGLKRALRRNRTAVNGEKKSFYYHAHTIRYMMRVLRKEFGDSAVRIESLRMFTKRVSQRLFRGVILGKTIFKTLALVENGLRRSPKFFTYVVYVAQK